MQRNPLRISPNALLFMSHLSHITEALIFNLSTDIISSHLIKSPHITTTPISLFSTHQLYIRPIVPGVFGVQHPRYHPPLYEQHVHTQHHEHLCLERLEGVRKSRGRVEKRRGEERRGTEELKGVKKRKHRETLKTSTHTDSTTIICIDQWFEAVGRD
jgi:hypothetical protein